MVDKIREYFIEVSNDYYKKEGYDYWNNHIKYVVEFAKKLASINGADLEVVEISAILHDVSKPLEERVDESHNVVSSEIAYELLKQLGYDDSKIEKVKSCIYYHSGNLENHKLSKEQWCVRNADILSILDNISIFYFLAYNEYLLNYEDGIKFVKGLILEKIKNLDIKLYEEYSDKFDIILNAI